MNSIINWVNVDARFNIKIAGESQLEQIIKREDIVIVLFTDESNQALNHLLKRVLNELEDSFGIATVEVSDLKGRTVIIFIVIPIFMKIMYSTYIITRKCFCISVSTKYMVSTFPSVILFEGGSPKQYLGDLRHSDDPTSSDIGKASKLKEWVLSSLEAQDRIVVKEISSDAFKSHPNTYNHVSNYILMIII